MKKKQTIQSNLQSMSKSSLSSLKGGSKEEDEEEDEGYITIYINGKKYKMKIDRDGKPTSLPEKLF